MDMYEEIEKMYEEENKMLMQTLKNLENLANTNEKIEALKVSLKKSFKKPAIISIKNMGKGNAAVNMNGTNGAILITLAALEKKVLNDLQVPKELWKMIQAVTRCEDDK